MYLCKQCEVNFIMYVHTISFGMLNTLFKNRTKIFSIPEKGAGYWNTFESRYKPNTLKLQVLTEGVHT